MLEVLLHRAWADEELTRDLGIGGRAAAPLFARLAIAKATQIAGPQFPSIWQSLTIPVLIIQGAEDQILRSPYTADALHGYMPHASGLIYEEAGHEVYVDQTRRFADDLTPSRSRRRARALGRASTAPTPPG